MFLPAALALSSLAMNAAGDLLGASAQRKQAAANKKAALASQVNQINDVNLREIQDQQATSQELQVAARQGRTALSSARLSAGEAGVTGNSVDALLTDIGAQGSTYSEDVKLNAANTKAQLERQKLGIYAQTQDRINGVQAPNDWATGLRIGGAAISTLSQFRIRQAPPDKATA